MIEEVETTNPILELFEQSQSVTPSLQKMIAENQDQALLEEAFEESALFRTRIFQAWRQSRNVDFRTKVSLLLSDRLPL